MRLAAIYIFDHFLFEESKIINYASKHNYKILSDGTFFPSSVKKIFCLFKTFTQKIQL